MYTLIYFFLSACFRVFMRLLIKLMIAKIWCGPLTSSWMIVSYYHLATGEISLSFQFMKFKRRLKKSICERERKKKRQVGIKKWNFRARRIGQLPWVPGSCKGSKVQLCSVQLVHGKRHIANSQEINVLGPCPTRLISLGLRTRLAFECVTMGSICF